MSIIKSIKIAALVGGFLLVGCGTDTDNGDISSSDTIEGGEEYKDKIKYASTVQFRAKGDFFEINNGAGWEKFYAKGINLSVAVPGKFPGELNEERHLYDEWLDRLADLNCNVVRLYTLHHPVFYQAFGEWNDKNKDRPIYLVQGIWLDELPEEEDYITHGTEQMEEEIKYVIDAVHGQADIPLRYGKAFGKYRHDVSDYVMAWLPGHEMMGEQVAASNEIWEEYTKYDGVYIKSPNGLPIEAWVARKLDLVIMYELLKYGKQRPMGWSNWPALDPIHHPTETSRFGQDLVDVDLGRFELVEPYNAGLFVSYHVYPFNPEFIIYDPEYVATKDGRGETNSYLGYMLDLKAHHQGIPLFITEFGVPSSMGVAHINVNGWNHGGYNETEQAAATQRLVESVLESGAAGMVLFELMDEWFKRSWMTNPTTVPLDRGRFWYDVANPEESFGIISYYPVPNWSVAIDGNAGDWGSKAVDVVVQDGESFGSVDAGLDPRRTVKNVSMLADPAFLFIRLDTASQEIPDLQNTAWYIGISTVHGETGDRRLPPETGIEAAGMGFESVLLLDAADGRFELLLDSAYDPSPRLSGRSKLGGTPEFNDDGEYQLASYLINNDDQYIASGKPVVPPKRFYVPGLLKQGDSQEDTGVHFQVGPGVIEIRLPWQTICVADPSSHQILFDDPEVEGFQAATTEGVQVVVVSIAREGDSLKVVDAAPRNRFDGSVFESDIPGYLWEQWEDVSWVAREKPAYKTIKDMFGDIK